MSCQTFNFQLSTFNLSKRRGYTLVELLIVITITTLLITFGVSAYSRAADIQAIKSTNETILSTLASAQKSATSGKSDCNGAYLGETVATTAGSSIITTTSSCEGGSGTPREIALSGFTFDSTTTLIFRPLNQGVITGASDPGILDYTNGQKTYRIQVYRSGTISSVGEITP